MGAIICSGSSSSWSSATTAGGLQGQPVPGGTSWAKATSQGGTHLLKPEWSLGLSHCHLPAEQLSVTTA